MKNLNGNKQKRRRRQKGVWQKNNRVASHWGDPSPCVFTPSTTVWKENRVTDTVVHAVVNTHSIRNSVEALTLRLSMQGSTTGIVIYVKFLCLIYYYFWLAFHLLPLKRLHLIPFPERWIFKRGWSDGRLSHVACVRGYFYQAPAGLGTPTASRLLLRIWYWGHEQTCRGANPADERSGDFESQSGTFPWQPEKDERQR